MHGTQLNPVTRRARIIIKLPVSSSKARYFIHQSEVENLVPIMGMLYFGTSTTTVANERTKSVN